MECACGACRIEVGVLLRPTKQHSTTAPCDKHSACTWCTGGSVDTTSGGARCRDNSQPPAQHMHSTWPGAVCRHTAPQLTPPRTGLQRSAAPAASSSTPQRRDGLCVSVHRKQSVCVCPSPGKQANSMRGCIHGPQGAPGVRVVNCTGVKCPQARTSQHTHPQASLALNVRVHCRQSGWGGGT
jgi:hypothetical protein